MWVYILTGVTFVTSLAMLGILIYCLVELGKLSFDNKKKKKEKMDELKEKNEELQRKIDSIIMTENVQSYVKYKKKRGSQENVDQSKKKD